MMAADASAKNDARVLPHELVIPAALSVVSLESDHETGLRIKSDPSGDGREHWGKRSAQESQVGGRCEKRLVPSRRATGWSR